ncbi:DNA polymerase I [uncultured Porphyromonas sp.]|uniref:DNA polymerase I n=1 Tax=uncultured Porphyromonas sp. TaxID=159274 RepID=UPI00263059E3|nr:DNA polymerase I [uncultured Porphyromonas sp.]
MTQKTSKRLYLIDAFAMIYRGYFPFANRPMLNRRGEDTSAVLGFVNTFDKILEAAEGEYLAVVFDPPGGTFRSEEYEEYKAQRAKQPEAITFALPYIREIITARGVQSYEVAGYEADDVIGTLATHLSEAHPELEVLMVTPDKDYGQLVTERVHMLAPGSAGGFDDLGPGEVAAKHDLTDETQVRDFLALMGDASDNVPGVPGIGKKRAADLLRAYGSIEGIYDHIDELKGKMKENLLEHREQLEASRHLVTIVTDVPIEVSLEEMTRGAQDLQRLVDLYDELDFRSKKKALLDESPVPTPRRTLFDLTPVEAAAEPPVEDSVGDLSTVEHSYTLITGEEEMKGLLEALSGAEAFSFDTETDGLDGMQDHLVGISVAVRPHEAWYLPLPEDMEEAKALLRPLAPFFSDPEKVKVAQNGKFDLKFLSRYDLHAVPPLWDTMLAHYLLDPEARHGLDHLSETLLRYRPIPIEQLIGKGSKQRNMRQVDPREVLPYAAEDADLTLQLYHHLRPRIEGEEHLRSLFYDIEMPLAGVLLEMEQAGVRVDVDLLQSAIVDLSTELERIEEDFQRYTLGDPVNINSPKEVGDFLFGRLGLSEKPKKTRTGQYSTREEDLEMVADRHPAVRLILDYRGLSKLVNTYLLPLPMMVNPVTGRIHTTYHQAKTATGRLSSSDPNLQNIPVRDEQGREIRKAFTANDPAAGDLFVSADYSQVELRLMAHLSGDTSLIEAFRHGADIHAATAAKIFGIPEEEVTGEMRRKAKTANFGIIYGISAFGLSARLGIPRGEAKELIDGYFSSFPGVKRYIDKTIEQAHKDGYVDTLFGRRRYIQNINSRNRNLVANAERMAINAPIQGTAADIIKVAMVRVARRLREEGFRSQMILQVHDELCFTVPGDERERLVAMVKEKMEQVLPSLSVPLVADVGVGENWLEAH